MNCEYANLLPNLSNAMLETRGISHVVQRQGQCIKPSAPEFKIIAANMVGRVRSYSVSPWRLLELSSLGSSNLGYV